MQLKPNLSVRSIGAQRFVVGIIAGLAFGSSFYLASVSVSRPGFAAFLGSPRYHAEDIRYQNEFWSQRVEGYRPRPVPEIVADPTATTPTWIEPFWAGLSAVFGQAVALGVWFLRPRRRSASHHLRGAAATGLMWVALVPLFLVKLWLIYLILVTRGNYWASAFGDPQAFDPLVPFFPFGASAALLVLFVAVEPWRGVQFAYRCGWWPAVSVVSTLAVGALLYGLGHIVVPGAM